LTALKGRRILKWLDRKERTETSMDRPVPVLQLPMMSTCRPAVLMLLAAGCFFSGNRDSGLDCAPWAGGNKPISLHHQPSTGGLPLARPLLLANQSSLGIRVWRLKIVLEETNHEIVDQPDLGPATTPGELTKSFRTDLSSLVNPITPHARC
jgi:hypothetical protein